MSRGVFFCARNFLGRRGPPPRSPRAVRTRHKLAPRERGKGQFYRSQGGAIFSRVLLFFEGNAKSLHRHTLRRVTSFFSRSTTPTKNTHALSFSSRKKLDTPSYSSSPLSNSPSRLQNVLGNTENSAAAGPPPGRYPPRAHSEPPGRSARGEKAGYFFGGGSPHSSDPARLLDQKRALK